MLDIAFKKQRFRKSPLHLIGFFLLLLPLFSSAQDTIDSSANSYKGYHSIKSSLIGGFDAGSQVFGYGLFYSYRNYRPFSFIPGFGIYQINYEDIDGLSGSALAFEGSGALNFQLIRRILNLRVTGYLGVHTKPDITSEKLSISGFFLGGGITFWRLNAEIELGAISYFGNQYTAQRVGLSYVFCRNKSFWPPK